MIEPFFLSKTIFLSIFGRFTQKKAPSRTSMAKQKESICSGHSKL